MPAEAAPSWLFNTAESLCRALRDSEMSSAEPFQRDGVAMYDIDLEDQRRIVIVDNFDTATLTSALAELYHRHGPLKIGEVKRDASGYKYVKMQEETYDDISCCIVIKFIFWFISSVHSEMADPIEFIKRARGHHEEVIAERHVHFRSTPSQESKAENSHPQNSDEIEEGRAWWIGDRWVHVDQEKVLPSSISQD